MRKSIFLFAFLCFAFTITSCSNDDNETPPPNETTPPTVVDPFAGNSSVEDVVITISNDDIDVAAITGAMIIPTLPEPNGGDIEMTVPTTEPLAFPEEGASGISGFKIELTPKNNFEGIYVQLDGATDYLDIPKSSLTIVEEDNDFLKKSYNNFELNIDLGSDVTPGTFCYEICIYDANGNISEPISVCVTVKFFGGNTTLVGEWNFATIKITEGDTNVEYAAGETFCESEDSYECNGEVQELESCEALPKVNIVFNEDGTYIFKAIRTGIDYYEGLSGMSCEIETYTDDGDEISREEEGKWSYDLDGVNQKRLILITYKETITYTVDSGKEEETIEYGSGETDLEENVLNVTENSFDISISDDDENEGVRTYYFSK